MTYTCQLMRSWHASAAGTTSYAGEEILAYSVRTRSTILTATILTSTKDTKRLNNGGLLLLRWLISGRLAKRCETYHHQQPAYAAPTASLGSEHADFQTAWQSIVHICRGRSCGQLIAAATEHCHFEYSGKHVGAAPTATEQLGTHRLKHQQLSQSLCIARPRSVQCVGLDACKRHACTCRSLAACVPPVIFRCCRQRAPASQDATEAM